MTARYNIFKEPKPPHSEYATSMSVTPSLCREEMASGMAKLPGERKEASLDVQNVDNVVRGHKL